MLLFAGAIPSCLYLADQLTGHMLHWWSADPGVPRNTMVVWRNAWCGRFITPHVDELASRGVEQHHVAALKCYWWGHAAIVVVYAAATLASLLVAHALRFNEIGIVFLASSSVLLLLTSAWADSRAKRSNQSHGSSTGSLAAVPERFGGSGLGDAVSSGSAAPASISVVLECGCLGDRVLATGTRRCRDALSASR